MLAGGKSNSQVLASLEAAATEVIDMVNPNVPVDGDVVTTYWDQEFKFDGSDGLGAEVLSGRTIIGIDGLVDPPGTGMSTAKYVHHFTLSGVSGNPTARAAAEG